MSILRTIASCIAVPATIFVHAWASSSCADEPLREAPAHAEANRSHEKEFVHPGIAHTTASIEFVKGKLAAGEQPWSSAWESLQESRHTGLDYRPNPRANVERGAYNNPNIGSSDFSGDAAAAYTQTLRWVLSGDQRHARKAAEIIDAWSGTLQTIKNHDAKLLVGMEGHLFCNAAELLRHNWGGWPEANQEQFREMVRNIWYPVIKDFHPSANGNWDASILQTMIAMGVFLDDHEMFDRAVNYFLAGAGNGAIGNYFNDFGECQESGRDQSHTQMGLDFLANTCETAWNQGVNLYGAKDNRLLLGFEYTAKYNLGFDVRYEPFRSFEGRYHYKQISKRGRLRPMYEKIYNHYHHRSGLPAEFTEKALLKTRDLAGSRSRNRADAGNENRKGSRSSLRWDTLMFAAESSGAKRSNAAAD